MKLTQINKTYGNKHVLKDITLEFPAGQITVLVGPSGSGKSTILRSLNLLVMPESGQYDFNGHQIDFRQPVSNKEKLAIRRETGMVFQNYNLIDYLTPLENVRLVNKQAGKDILLELGLDETQIKRNVLQLSGGQQQRVAIARALVSEAPVILADEPTGNLDEQTAGDIIAILKKLAKERQKCVIVVTHSKEVAEASDVVLELSRRSLVEKSK